MIRTLLAHQGGLARGSLAFLLSLEPDIRVVAELDHGTEAESAVRMHRPDVIVIDLDLVDPTGMPLAWTLRERLPGTPMLILADRRRSSALTRAMADDAPRTGFLAKHNPAERLVTAVRGVARGVPVRDTELLLAATRAGSPLTRREQEVLWVAANGGPVREIAATLSLASGTVNNHLSRIINKTGSRTRLEAINTARNAGWF
jgi:two-component system response regulator DesR